MKAIGGFLDGGFGEAGYLEEAARNGGVAGGVEGRRGFGLVGSGGGVGGKRGGGADFDFDVVEGAGRSEECRAAGRRAPLLDSCSHAWRVVHQGVRCYCWRSLSDNTGGQYA